MKRFEPLSDHDHIGFWGAPSSSIDWCERNYVVSWWIAEFWNTISNVAIIAAGLFNCYQAYRYRMDTRFRWLGLGLALIGCGSFAFHGTLLYNMQMADELPMIYSGESM